MMSISSQGGQQRRPSVVATGKKAPPDRKPADEVGGPADEVGGPADEVGEPAGERAEAAPSPAEAPAAAKASGDAADGRPASATRSTRAKSSDAKAAGANAAVTRAAGAKAAGAKAAGAKAAGAKGAAGPKAAGGRSTATKAGAGVRTKAGAGARAKAGAGARAKAGAGARPGTRAGGPPRRPITPVKVSQGRSWGPIALFTAVGLLAAGIIGWGAWAVYQNSRSWEDKAGSIRGIVDYRKTDPGMLTRTHKTGQLQYKVTPPVGGDHNPTWQRCMGDVYDAQIPRENAVHSLEHGAIWITYRPDLPKDQVDKLAKKVRGKDFLLMSPFPGLDRPISLQAWGYQLKVNNAKDGRIDDFISALRQNATMEPGAVCSAGNYTTGTGTTPRDLSQQQNPGGGTGG